MDVTLKPRVSRPVGHRVCTHDLCAVTLRLCDVVLAISDADVWVLRCPGGLRRQPLLRGVGVSVLGGGYVVRRRGGDAAFALGRLPEDDSRLRVRFTSTRLRWRADATVPATPLSGRLWAAEAGGDFDLAVLEVDGAPLTVARLAPLR
jgi:hypothetical protein